MNFSAFHPFVVPSVPHLPIETIDHHVRQAAIAFCARTLVWNDELPPLLSLVGIDRYTPALEPDAVLCKLLAAWVGDQEYEVESGSTTRAQRRRGSPSQLAYTDRDQIVLTPAPTEAGKEIVVEAVMKPTINCTELPDALEEFIADIAMGALGSLLLLPGEHNNPSFASIQAGMFERRIGVIGTRVTRGFSSARVRKGAAQFF